MKKSIIITTLGFCLAAASASAQQFEELANVVNVSPNIENVAVPFQTCDQVSVPVQQGSSNTGSFLGAVAGGLLGNTVGQGNGRIAAAAVGAATGALVGNNLSNQGQQGGYQPQQRCYTQYQQQSRQNGYRVAYEYAGHSFTTVLPYDPGRTVRVIVNVMAR